MGRSLNSSSLGVADRNASGSNALITLTGRDAFNKGDLVYVDYKSGNVVNLSGTPLSLAVTAGPAADFTAHASANGTAASSSAAVTFANGDYATVVNTWSSTTDTNQRLTISRYSNGGALQQSKTVIVGGSNPAGQGLVACPLQDGIGFTIAVRSTTTLVVYIFDRNLNNYVVATIAANIAVYAIASTSDGGALVYTDTGIWKVSGTGGVTQPVSFSLFGPAENMTIGSISTRRTATDWSGQVPLQDDTGFFSISSSGLGSIAATSTGASYYQFNSDGSVRGTATVLVSGITNALALKFARGTSGNIFWILNHLGGSTWGIISDSGTVVKASALIASSDVWNGTNYAGYIKCVTDANGDFFFTWSSASGATLNTNWVGATTGTPKSGFPRTDVMPGGTSGGVKTASLSTGVVLLLPTTTSLYFSTFSFFNLAGTLVVNRAGILSGTSSGLDWATLTSIAVYGDVLYGIHSITNGPVNSTQGTLFKITNTGAKTQADFAYVTPKDTVPLLIVNAGDITAYMGNYMLRLRTPDLNQCAFSQFTTVTYPANALTLKVVMAGTTALVCSQCNSGTAVTTTGTPNWNAWFFRVKPDSTTLVGVATSTSAAGGPVEVQTKGSAYCTAQGAITFDQSAASPVAGQKGIINNQIVTLAGINGV